MKKYIILMLLLFCFSVYGQSDTIDIGTDKFITLHFPAKVEFKQTSVSTDGKIGIRIIDENVFLQFLTNNVPESNILIKTIDGYYYSFILRYHKDPDRLNIFFNIEDALNQNDNNYSEKYHNRKEKINENYSEKVLKEKGYLKSRNLTLKKGIKLILKGIYSNSDKLYFLIELSNSTNIPFDIENYTFSITNKKNVKETSQQSSDVQPISIENRLAVLDIHKTESLVFVFKKFTIDQNKTLRLDITEKNGDRNLTFNILPSMIDEARRIK